MRITWLLEVTDQLWGGVKVALENANWLQRRGHQVTVLSRSGPPPWMRLECTFQRVSDFRAERLPDADVLIGTFWTTVPWVATAGPTKGTPIHFCQGYEGDNPENAALRDRIEAVYRLPGMHHVTISPHLTSLLHTKFGIRAQEVIYAIDHAVHHPGPVRTPGRPLRVGLVGPYQIAWKDLPTGYEACRLAHQAGQPLVLVRATNTTPDARELNTQFPIEWHQQLPPAQMGDFYRSLDLFLGTSCGAEEGFFLPAIEAMACGVPSVLTEVPCFENHEALLGNRDYALFVPARNAAAMAEALVLAGSLPDVRATLRRAGLALASHYHPDRHGEQLEQVLQSLTSRSSDRQPLRLVHATTEGETDLSRLTAQLRRAGESLARNGDHARAAQALTAAHVLTPDDAPLLYEAATAHLANGAPDTALRLYDELVDKGVEDEALHTARGHALHVLGKMREAAQAFRAALAIGARSADAYNRLGVVLFQAGDFAAARVSFERALVLQPDHDDARANLTAMPAA